LSNPRKQLPQAPDEIHALVGVKLQHLLRENCVSAPVGNWLQINALSLG